MSTPLHIYSQVKNNYYVGYFGDNDQVLVELKKIRLIFEQAFKDLRIFIVCKEEKIDEPRMIAKLDKNFAYYKEICNLEDVKQLCAI